MAFIPARRDFTLGNIFDLHVHSTASDGQYQPAELMRLAAERGISTLALTDHDSIDGLDEARAEADRLGLRFIPGVELSVDFPNGEMHILGYGIRADEPLLSYLAEQKQNREQRNQLILEKLQALGFALTMDDVIRHTYKNVSTNAPLTIGRPHFAMAMIEKGYISSISEAFDRYLGKGQPAYFGRKQSLPEEAIPTIRAAGGVAVLAHPILLGQSDQELRHVLERLIGYGLEGIEALHSEQDKGRQRFYRSLATYYELLPTGGSDFHGPIITPDVEIGTGLRNNLKLDDMSIVENLLARIEKRRQENASDA